jgi:hypothetical protein
MNRSSTRAFAILSAALMVYATAARAEAPSVQILVDGVDDDARRCGLSQDSISSQVAITLRALGIRISETRTNPWLYVNVNVLDGPAACIANIQVRLEGMSAEDISRAPMGGFHSRDGRFTSLCEYEYVASQPRQLDPAAALLKNVEMVTKTCLGKVDY